MLRTLPLLLLAACDPPPPPPPVFAVEVATLGVRLRMTSPVEPVARWLEGILELELEPGTRGSPRLMLHDVQLPVLAAESPCADLSRPSSDTPVARTSVSTFGPDSVLRFVVAEDLPSPRGPESRLQGCWSFHGRLLAVQCTADARALYTVGAPLDPTWCVGVLATAEPVPD